MEPKRLNKYISDAGFCSRREADRLIEEGRVTVNNKIPETGAMVGPKDKVRIDDELLHMRQEETIFLLFNKPAGIATTTDLSVRNNIISALNYPASLQPIGHLEREAEGLMFLSNDTELARRMTKADTRFEKEYVVTVDKPILGEFLTRLSEGSTPAPGVSRKKLFVAKMGTNRFRIVLEPGVNHHLKRMCEALGYQVTHLQRVRIANFTPIKLQTGHWRALSEAEVDSLKTILSKKGNAGSRREIGKDLYEEELPNQSNRPRVAGVRKPVRTGGVAGARPKAGAGSRGATKGAGVNRKPAAKSSAAAGRRTTAPKNGGRRASSAKGTPKR